VALKEDRVTITDVTLREYGQNVPSLYLPVFTPRLRADVAGKLIQAGLPGIEIFSCISPRIAPAMAREEIEKTLAALGETPGAKLITLVPNETGYENFHALNLGPGGRNHTMGLFFSAIEAHNLLNLGRTIRETLEEYKRILTDAASRKIRVVGYVSAAFGYRNGKSMGVTRPDVGVLNDYLDFYFDLGVQNVTLSDLQGVAGEEETGRTLEALLNKRKGADMGRLGYHPHHVDGEKALSNSRIAFNLGLRRFDASLGGTGGCVTGAPGNQPTEGLVRLFEKQGIKTGVKLAEVLDLARFVEKELYGKIPSSGQPDSPHPARGAPRAGQGDVH